MITDKELKEYSDLKNEYQNIIDTKILERCNKIVQIGAFTAKLDDEGKVELASDKFPTQFTGKSAGIIAKMNWRSTNDKKPTIEVLSVKDWYQNRINVIDAILNSCKK